MFDIRKRSVYFGIVFIPLVTFLLDMATLDLFYNDQELLFNLSRLLLIAVLVGFLGAMLGEYLIYKCIPRASNVKMLNRHSSDHRELGLMEQVDDYAREFGIRPPLVAVLRSAQSGILSISLSKAKTLLLVSEIDYINQRLESLIADLKEEIFKLVNGVFLEELLARCAWYTILSLVCILCINLL